MIKIVEVSSLKPLIDQFPTFYHFIDHKSMKKMVPKRISHSHKGTYGKVLCVGGSQTMSGSITLASLAAYRSGCGIVTSAIPSCIQATVASSLHEMMTLPLDEVNGEMAESCCKQLAQVMNQYSCILYGCGCGRASQQVTILQTLLHSHVPLIIDADGLTALKPLLSTLDPHRKLILTPHLAEFARLFDFSLEDVIEHRYACLQKVQQRYPQLIVVLKSETTMIHSQSCCWINNYGNSGLAVGGSGDTLAGMIAGWLAQSQCELESCVLGVYLHACCADEVVKKRVNMH